MLRVTFTIIILIALTCFNQAKAQLLNVESVRTNADSAGWHGELEFDMSLNRYNERVLQFTNESNLSFFSHQHAYMLLNRLKFVNIDGNSLISSGYIHLRSTFLRNERWSPEIFLQYQYNNNLGLNNRGIAGAGVKYKLFENELWTANISTAVMMEHEVWQLDNQPSIKNDYLKSTSNVSLRGKVSDSSTFLLIGYYQARPDQFLEARSIFESRLKVNITKQVALSVGFTASYDAAPVIDIPSWTYELSNGLVIAL